MIIKRLLLRNYRKFREKEMFFGPGINVISGNNEAGKSTITQALLDGFYVDPTTQAKVVLNRIKPWHEAKPAYIELELEEGETGYILVKDFAKKEALFKNIDTGKQTTDLEEISVILNELMGLPTREMYHNTAFISHNDIAKIETTRDFVNAIQNVATETDNEVNIQNIIFELESEIKRIRKGMDRPAGDLGPLKASELRIIQLEKEIAQTKEVLAKTNSAAKQGLEAKDELSEIDERIMECDLLLKNYTIFEKATQRTIELDAQIDDIEGVIVAYNELDSQKRALEAEMKYYKPFLEQDSEKAANDVNYCVEMRKMAISELNKYALSKEEVADQISHNFIVEGGLYLIGVLIGISAFYFSQNWLLAFVPAFVWIGLVGIGIYVFRRSRSAKSREQKMLINDSEGQWKQRVRDASNKIKSILDQFQVEDVGSFFTNKAKFNMQQERFKEIVARMAGLISNQTIEDLRQKQMFLIKSKKEIEINELTDEVRRSKIDPQDYLAKSRELEALMNKRKSLEMNFTTARVRLEDSVIDIDVLMSLQEDLEQQQLVHSQLVDKEKMLHLTSDTIRASLKQTSQTANSVVEKEVEKYLSQLTDNRYQKIRVDDKFCIKVFSGEKNDWVDPIDSLSKGTVDQIYFLTRVAFLKAILKNKTAPIICDDPFVTFDSERLQFLNEILSELADVFQVILLSCDHEYDEWGAVLNYV